MSFKHWNILFVLFQDGYVYYLGQCVGEGLGGGLVWPVCAYEYLQSVIFGVSWRGWRKKGFFFFFSFFCFWGKERKRNFFAVPVHHLVRSVLIIWAFAYLGNSEISLIRSCPSYLTNRFQKERNNILPYYLLLCTVQKRLWKYEQKRMESFN